VTGQWLIQPVTEGALVVLGEAYETSGFRRLFRRGLRRQISARCAYGMEESDLSLELFAAGQKIYEAEDLRVFHDSDLKHHHSAEVTSAAITNVGLHS
jgi:hypothetical protein